ncbi:MAG: SH3 domain-containing protein [Anaerolineae bacterium]|nr:SH3 domain-containing protein [Anaerolineae bacterium]
MKRLLLLFPFLLLAYPALAQNNPDLITLDDATPAIDVVISLPDGTTGTIALNVAMASVTLTDQNNAVVFHAADERLHGVEFNIAPNSGTHTLTVERLPGAAAAYVSVVSLPEMTVAGETTVIDGTAISLNEESALTLDASSPAGSVSVSIPADTTGVVTATFPGAGAATQLVDTEGTVLAQSVGGHVDGLSFVLDSGDYDFAVQGNNLTDAVVAGVRVISSIDGGFTVLEAPQTPAASPTQDVATAGEPCTATVSASSVNLRSGPGTGYSVLGYGYRGESYQVGGQNTEGSWIVIGTGAGDSAWVARSAAQMQGSCQALTVFDIPYREAQAAPIVITAPQTNTSSYQGDSHYENEGHEEHDDDHNEHDDD